MTNIDSVLKSRDITLPIKGHLVKAMVFLVVMYGWESWTVKKAERRRLMLFFFALHVFYLFIYIYLLVFFFHFIILYWFCHTSTCLRHGCTRRRGVQDWELMFLNRGVGEDS